MRLPNFWKITSFTLSILLLLFLPPRCLIAAILTLQTDSRQVTSNQPFVVSFYLKVNVKNKTTYYLRPLFYLPNTTKYFGCVKVNEQWTCSPQSDCHRWFPVTLTPNQKAWEGNLTLKAEAPPGEYFLKLRRYTAKCNTGSSSDYNSNEILLTFLASPTPTISAPPTPTPTQTTNSPTPTPIPTIYLSEICPNPHEGNEWVEIYNPNSFAVQLQNWQIDDEAEQGGPPYQFNLTLETHQFGIVELNRSLLNNDGDTVRLLSSTGSLIDQVSYPSVSKGISYSKQASGEWCLTQPTKNSTNAGCLSTPTSTPTPSFTPTPTPLPTLISSTPDISTYISTNSLKISTRVSTSSLKLNLEEGKGASGIVLAATASPKATFQSHHLTTPLILTGIGVILIALAIPFWQHDALLEE